MKNNAFIFVRGMLGADPVLRSTKSGDDVLTFSVADNRGYCDKAADKWVTTNVTWWQCSYWGRDARDLEYAFKKGDLVAVVDVPELRTFTRKDGSEGAAASIQVESVWLRPHANRDGNSGAGNMGDANADDPWGGGGNGQPPF